MMTLNFIVITFLVLFNFQLHASGGGASTVGDGGHVVVCGNQIELLDIYERNILFGSSSISLGDENLSQTDLVQEGLNRIISRFNLTPETASPIVSATKMFLRFPFDPWKLPGKNGLLQTQKINMYRPVNDHIIQKNCWIDIVVIRPKVEGNVQNFLEELCDQNYSEHEFCFFTKREHYRRLTKQQRACLVVHESLRYLPLESRISDELVLRQTAAEICTQ